MIDCFSYAMYTPSVYCAFKKKPIKANSMFMNMKMLVAKCQKRSNLVNFDLGFFLHSSIPLYERLQANLNSTPTLPACPYPSN